LNLNKSLIYQLDFLEAGVPIGAHWDPTELSFYALYQALMRNGRRGPGRKLIHILCLRCPLSLDRSRISTILETPALQESLRSAG
jgi:hypothetical protein